MDLPVYEWLNEQDYARWICPEMSALLAELKSRGNGIKAVGLGNYRSPQAIIFLERPLSEHLAKKAAFKCPALRLIHDGVGQLHAVSCIEHYVRARFAERPG